MKKANLNPNISITDRNNKSVSTDTIYFLTWNLPSIITCPYGTEMCKKRCFATKWERINKKAVQSRTKNFEESKKSTFVEDMIDWFEYNLQRPKAINKKIFVRIHTSGDFYSLDYFEKWISITNHFKGNDKILFQAYTKSMPILYKYFYPDDDTEEYDNWYGDIDENSSILHAREELKNINIHFVWSIWDDTPKDYTAFAKYIGLQTFTALPKDKIAKTVENGAFECKGDCGNCRQCYTGKVEKIVIPYH